MFFGSIRKQKCSPWLIPQKGGTLNWGARYVGLWASCLEYRILEINSFSAFFSYVLYWAELFLHMPLLYCTTDQVRVSSICVNVCRSYTPFWIQNIGNTQFCALFCYMIWHIELKPCIWLCYTVIQIKFECRQFSSICVGVMSLLELTMLEIHIFPHFSPTYFDILSWNLVYDFLFYEL